MKLFTVEHIHRWEIGHDADRDLLVEIFKELKLIYKQNQSIMLTQEQLVQGLKDVNTQLTKIKGESTATLQKVSDLEEALKNQGNISPEVETAFNAVKAQTQSLDDLIVDAPTPGTGGEVGDEQPGGGQPGSTL